MIYTITLNPALDRELTVPALIPAEVLRATASRVDVGGKGFNVARMVHTLGGACTALGLVGGHAGTALKAGLEQHGIVTALTPIAHETRTNISIVPADGGAPIKVNEPGPTVSAAELAALRVQVRANVQPNTWWVLAGSCPPGVPEDFYATLIMDLRAAGAYVALDASGAPVQHGAAAGPHLLKPNARELSELTGHTINTPVTALAAARTLTNIDMIIVSLGKAGALLVSAEHALLAVPPPITERNPVGAGDALLGGVVWARSNGHTAADALRWGVACGAAAAASVGTGQGTRDDIEKLVAKVWVKQA